MQNSIINKGNKDNLICLSLGKEKDHTSVCSTSTGHTAFYKYSLSYHTWHFPVEMTQLISPNIYMQQYHLPGSLHSTEIRILEEMRCLNPFTTLEHSGPILCRTRSTAISKLGHYPRIFHIWTEPLSNSPFLIFLCTKIKGASETEDFAFWSWITLLQQHRWNIRYKAVFLAKLQCYPE